MSTTRRVRMGLCGCAALAIALVMTGRAEEKKEARKHPFSDNVKVTITDTHMVVESDGIPNHDTGDFPNRDNPNRIRKQNYRFYIPLKPKVADKPTKTPFGPIGIALNGIPFYNQYNAEGKDAVKLEKFDSCCGHPDPQGRYHYHKYPVCVKSPFKDEAGKHSPLIGYAFDGFGIYGPNGDGGKPPADLDECNGHSDKERGYHYHVTEKFPYLIGAYKGVVEQKNFDRPGRPDREDRPAGLDRILDGLKLTDKQREKADPILRTYQDHTRNVREKLREDLLGRMKDVLSKDQLARFTEALERRPGPGRGSPPERALEDLKLTGKDGDRADEALKAHADWRRKQHDEMQTDLLAKMKDVLDEGQYKRFEKALKEQGPPGPPRDRDRPRGDR